MFYNAKVSNLLGMDLYTVRNVKKKYYIWALVILKSIISKLSFRFSYNGIYIGENLNLGGLRTLASWSICQVSLFSAQNLQ